jgi:hypothetical protein
MPRGVKSTLTGISGAKVRPLAPPRGVVRPGGAHHLGVGKSPILIGGPGRQPLPGIITGNTSLEEWPIWWACWKYFKQKPGQGAWDYQARFGTGTPGGIKPDFIINGARPTIMRVQSDQYHIKVSSWKAAYDVDQRVSLEKMGFTVIDVFPQYYLVDNYGPLTGKAAIATVQEAEMGRQRADPRATRTSWARG